ASALLLAYHRMLADQLRHFSLAGLSDQGNLSLQLAPLYVERALAPLSSSSAPDSPAPCTLSAALAALGARVLLQGDSGSGKTIALQRIVLACATRATGARSQTPDLLESWGAPLPLPIFLPAREIASALGRANADLRDQQIPTLAAFWAAIDEWLRYSDLSAL